MVHYRIRAVRGDQRCTVWIQLHNGATLAQLLDKAVPLLNERNPGGPHQSTWDVTAIDVFPIDPTYRPAPHPHGEDHDAA